MKQENEPLRFEDRLEQLEQLTVKMEEGKLSLEELLKVYEQGIALSTGLKRDLDAAQATLTQLKDGQLKPIEDS